MSRPTTSMYEMPLSERENAATFLQYTTVKPFVYLSYPHSFKCFYCNEIYFEISKLLVHSNDHQVPERAEMMKDILRKGRRTVKVDISKLKCKLCNVKFTSLDDARKHLTTDHGKEFTPSGNGLIAYNLETKNSVFSCHLCSESFHSFFLLNKHMNIHYSNAICETCGKAFVSHKRLQQHKEIHLKAQYPCEKCKKLFPSIAKLKYHEDKVHGNLKKVKLLKCQQCSERFLDHYKKMKHLREFHGVSFTFTCEICKAIFKTRKALNSHTTKFHTQNIMCDICKKPFSERSHLKKHMTVHTEERNYVCSLCKKSYRHEKNMKDHIMRVHNPEWRFACSECWVGFPNKIEFRKHMDELHP